MAYLRNLESPVVVSLNLARVGFSEDGTPQVCSSFNATRALFNPSITEVKNLIQSAKDEKSPIMGDSFVIHSQIHKLETKYDWIYDGCPKCGSKVKGDDPSWICSLCKKQPEPKMKLHYLVRDKTGSTSVIFWDKLVVQLVKKTASELKCLVNEVSEDAPIEESEPSSPKAIGQHDVLIVSPGVLGRLVAEKWRENCECKRKKCAHSCIKWNCCNIITIWQNSTFQLGKTVIEAITLNGSHPNQKVIIHRMDMNSSESIWPFRMKRRQFPITLSFAMTINKIEKDDDLTVEENLVEVFEEGGEERRVDGLVARWMKIVED
ncbi:hypothetical protein K1719_022739 [Acacia pycnantha]|nr:hypothetical protein K1719_022739 [Acacia pycnantha]